MAEHSGTFACAAAPPQPSILGGGSSRYDFGDEDAGVVAHVGVVGSTRYAESEARVSLQQKRRERKTGKEELESEACLAACSLTEGGRGGGGGVNKARANMELHHHCTHSLQRDLLVFDLPLRAVDLSGSTVCR